VRRKNGEVGASVGSSGVFRTEEKFQLSVFVWKLLQIASICIDSLVGNVLVCLLQLEPFLANMV
jgi:hypothetical protein